MQVNDLYRALDQGAVLLTANNRLARHYKKAYDHERQARGDKVWPSAGILPFEAWLQGVFRELQARQDSPLSLLNDSQQLMIWQQILGETGDNYPTLNLPATARSVQKAWAIACAWRFGFDHWRAPMSLDQRQFIAWAEGYRKHCSSRGLIDQTMLADYLGDPQTRAAVVWPQHIILTGFYELTPQQQVFLDGLRESGIRIDRFTGEVQTGSTLSRVSPPDDKSELQMAARWARLTLEQHPDWRLAVIVPDLQERKTALEYCFSRSFYPGYRPDQVEQAVRPWNTSLGMPLALTPLAETALLLLELALRPLSTNELTRLLLSTYLASGEQEKDRRAEYDAAASTRQRLSTGLAVLRSEARKSLPGLSRALGKIAGVDLSGKQPMSVWSQRFGKVLDSAGWPGERSLDSEEYQQAEAVRSVLGGIAALDAFTDASTAGQALAMLRQIMTQTTFQAQGADTPVQVLGLMEVTGLSFDAALICSMDNQKWPVAGTPNPYLPLAWQRDVGAPHASPARELEFAQYTMTQLKSIAGRVIFSHVAMRDENTLRPAHALADLPELDVQPWLWKKPSVDTAGLETLQDDFGPPVADGEHVHGGSGLLAAQAACPFRAFVRYRLLTDGLELAEMQVDPRDRGNLIHGVLEAFWKLTRDQQTLLGMSDEALEQRIEETVEQVMQGFSSLPGLGYFEKNRLLAIVREWLDFEKSRQPFVNESTEEVRELLFEGLKINMIIDRIDTVSADDGSQRRVIIDYKSGSRQKPASWMEERPDEPQLPIYALSDERPVAAISYAVLTKRELCFRGFADREDLLPGVGLPQRPKTPGGRGRENVDWDEALEQWRTHIAALAGEIRQGLASVTPKKGACQWCALTPVCRIADVAVDEDDKKSPGEQP
ncbi:MAG: PD-(D/E)XK nuclease family protein [Gammaproteobacteria bacterium]|nr:PD-(D/E)XK nuclease family protein [Gammaproteobacteria bacterium]